MSDSPAVYASLPPTPLMGSVGLTFGSLLDYAKHAVHLLQTTGDTFLDLLDVSFRMWSAVSSRDLSGILRAFSDGRRDVESIIAAIKAEFGI